MSLTCFIPFTAECREAIGQVLRNSVYPLDSRVPDSLAQLLDKLERRR